MNRRRESWEQYLTEYHHERPGITERAFDHATDPRHGSPHDWLVSAIPHKPGDVLDVACGSAPLHPRLVATASSYFGVDASHAELEEAKRRARGPVTHGDARDLPVADASADTVVSAMGLMLVQPLDAAIREVARVLRPGGTVALLLPATSPLHLADMRPLLALVRHLGTPGSMPQRVTRRRLFPLLRSFELTVTHEARHRFAFPLHTRDNVRLALRSLYTPSHSHDRIAAAENALARLAGSGRSLPLPLQVVVARKAL